MKTITLILLLLLAPLAYSDSTKIGRFANDFNLTNYEADIVIKKLVRTIRKVQKSIMFVADSDNKKSDKIAYIDYSIKEFFISENSMVGISSLNRKKATRRTIRDYLETLALLSDEKYGKYSDVKIYFGEKILLEGIGERSEDTAIMDISSFQVFRGCFYLEKRECYSDVTKKMFSTNIYINRSNIYATKVKLSEINVIDTYTFKDSVESGNVFTNEDYEKLKKLMEGG